MPEAEEAEDAEDGEEEDSGPVPGEVDEINEDSIKELAAAAAGGDDGGDDDDDEEDMEIDTGASGELDPQVQVAMERVKSNIEMLKEQNSSTQDRLQTMSSNVGEIRQMVHEQESDVSDLEADVGLMKDQMEDLDPQKLSKRMNELQADIDSNQAEMQKLQEKLQLVGEKAEDAQSTLNELGSMDNLIELNKEFEEKLDEIKEAERYIERLAQKSEKINIQINKKMTEYSTYKARVDAIQEKVDDMFRKLDDVSVEVSDAVDEAELEQTRERIKELEDQVEEFEKIAPIAEMTLPEPIRELRDERSDIENFLDELEHKHNKGKVETSKYEKLKQANEDRLDEINQKLVQEWENLEEVAESGAADGGGGGEGGGPGGDGGEGASGEGGEGADEAEEGEGDDEDATDEDAEAADEDGEDDEDEEDEEEEDEEEEIDDYEAIADQSAEEVKKAVNNKNLDLTELLKAERSNKNRNELLEWIEAKMIEG